jgi:SagB-type dehydrogenase family enzyme
MISKQQAEKAATMAEPVNPTQLVATVEEAEKPSPRKQELLDIASLLSDYECEHLLRLVKDVAAGERFWEGDVGIFYNEYVKARYFNYVRNPAAFGSAAPQSAAGIYAPIPIEKRYPDAKRIPLPTPERMSASITDLLLNRRSRREYAELSLSLAQLATLLEHGCGTTGAVSTYGYKNVPLRTFPSSGGLQATELYLFVQKVEGVGHGLYHYNPTGRALELLKPGDHMPLVKVLVPGEPLVGGSAAVMVFTGCYERIRWKYGARAYRYMCMDIGFMGENLYLAAEAMQLGFCAIAGFIEDELEQFLGIDGQNEMALLVASVGARRTSDV